MIKSLPKSLAAAVAKCPTLIGIGPSAWPRIITSFYFPKFEILCYSDCQDNEYIAKTGVPIYSLRKIDPYLELYAQTPGRILDTKLAMDWLAGHREPFAFVIYKSLAQFEKICKSNNWSFVGNPKDLRDRYENKRVFKEIVRELGLPSIPGENIPVDDLTPEKFMAFQKKLGQKHLVLQLAEATWGGGCGTLFIDDAKKLPEYYEMVAKMKKNLTGKKKQIETVNVAPYITGETCSIPCCTTKFGVLTGSIQTQIIDVPEVGTKLAGRSGNFAGHDWVFRHYSNDCQKQATLIAQRFGDYLYKQGYKGIFGLDLIVDGAGKVWPVECNPRETDAFPVVCMLQMEAGAIPMQVFHNLEHLNIPYTFDFDEVDQQLKTSYSAGQILLYNKTADFMVDTRLLKAGVYRVTDGKLTFVRPGFATWDLKHEDEYLITEDVPKEVGTTYAPHERMLRVIRRGGILKAQGELLPEVTKVVELIYEKLKLVNVKHDLVDEGGIKTLYTSKVLSAKEHPDLAKADLVNVIRPTRDGYYRPISIAWRKQLDQTSVLSQIKSKRARKQIVADNQKLPAMDITISVVEKITDTFFDEWLKLYREIISQKEGGQLAIDEHWLAKKIQKGITVGAVVVRQREKLIGGELFFVVNHRLSIGYGVAKRVDGLAGGLTLLMDYQFMNYAQKKGFNEISFGVDDNLYGAHLSVGLLAYKAKLGFTPQPAPKTYWVSSFIQKPACRQAGPEAFSDPVIFFGGTKKSLEMVVLSKEGANFDPKPYLPTGVTEVKLLKTSSNLRTESLD